MDEAKVQGLRKDLAELEALAKQATRQKVRDLLLIQAAKVYTELSNFQKQGGATTLSQSTEKPTAASSNKRTVVRVTNYGYDDQLGCIVFYVTIPNIQNLPKDNINCVFQERSIGLTVSDLDNKDYVFNLENLADKIAHTNCSWKLKKDRIEIKCVKQSNEKWKFVTLNEKKVAEAKKAETDTTAAKPEDGLFSLMKNMYEQGDDMMKQTISKAWEQSHMNQPAPY